MSAPQPCGAVFRVGVNAPASCVLCAGHAGSHRDWLQLADERGELLEALDDLLNTGHGVVEDDDCRENPAVREDCLACKAERRARATIASVKGPANPPQ